MMPCCITTAAAFACLALQLAQIRDHAPGLEPAVSFAPAVVVNQHCCCPQCAAGPKPEITHLAWNRKVQHILGTCTAAGTGALRGLSVACWCRSRCALLLIALQLLALLGALHCCCCRCGGGCCCCLLLLLLLLFDIEC